MTNYIPLSFSTHSKTETNHWEEIKMTETYNTLLKEHIVHALTNTQIGTLKEYTQQLIQQNYKAREEILEAYEQINKDLVGTINE